MKSWLKDWELAAFPHLAVVLLIGKATQKTKRWDQRRRRFLERSESRLSRCGRRAREERERDKFTLFLLSWLCVRAWSWSTGKVHNNASAALELKDLSTSLSLSRTCRETHTHTIGESSEMRQSEWRSTTLGRGRPIDQIAIRGWFRSADDL